MTAINDFRLIYELYDNIAIIDENLEVVFTGRSLKHILDRHKIELELKSFNAASSNLQYPISRFLKDNILSVLSSGNPATLRLEISGIEFLIIKTDKGVLLGLKDKITEITKIESELKDRVKELECLYNITKEYYQGKTADEFLRSCTKHIEAAFPYPDDTFANIEIGRNTYGDSSWDPEEIIDVLISGIYSGNRKLGELKVYIRKGEGSHEEEQKFIDEVSGKISKILEKEEETRNLEKQQEILKAKNKALIAMTEECYQKREKLKTFFRAITEKIIVIDRNFDIVMSNKDEIGDEGKCYNKLFGKNERCQMCPAEETFTQALDFSLEREFDERYFMMNSYPIRGIEGKVERVLEVCRDITEQKNMEAKLIQSYKLASLGKLVAGVAHEINNPNTFILGNLKIVQEAFEDIIPLLDKIYEQDRSLKIARLDYGLFKDNISILISDMVEGANRTKKIVGDLRNFAKKDESTLTDVIDLNEIVKNSLSLTEKHIKKYARLKTELSECLPFFNGNIYKLEQVVVNLTMNALEAIESNEGLIKIKTIYDESSGEVLLIVSDNGIGMDESTLKNIFDPFYTTKRNKGGTGLGLSITYGIIKDHGGRIDVSSRPGTGTEFRVHFPIKK
ncbi:MAG: ATP-binding protein [Bacillota bacterium]